MARRIYLPLYLRLFRKTATDVKTNPDDYLEAGEWLDVYCTKNRLRERTEERIKNCEEMIECGYSVEPELEMYKSMLETDLYVSDSELLPQNPDDEDFYAAERTIRGRVGFHQYVYTWRDTMYYFLRDQDT